MTRSIKILFLGVIFASVIVNAGCSYSVDFAVINESSNEIVVRYVYNEAVAFNDGKAIFTEAYHPYLISNFEFRSAPSHKDWQISQDAAFEIINGKTVITQKLKPKMSVRIANVYDFDPDGPAGRLNIDKLEITGRDGEIVLSGDQIKGQFKYENGFYFIVFKK